MKTENNVKVFSGKGIAMMHECKRMLNHSTSDQGLLCASRATGRTEATAMHTFLVPQPPPEDTDSEASSDATESNADESKADGNAIQSAPQTSNPMQTAMLQSAPQRNHEATTPRRIPYHRVLLQSTQTTLKTAATKLSHR